LREYTTTAPDVRRAFFPLDEQLRVRGRKLSEGVARLATWLSGMLTFSDASEVLDKVGGIKVSASTVWREVQVRGERIREAEAPSKVEVVELEEEPLATTTEQRPPKRMGSSMDGGMMYIKGEGWKEAKVGVIFDVAIERRLDERSKELVEVGHAVNNSYVAHLGGPEMLGALLWKEARRRRWEEADETVVLGDGAPWIWNLVSTHFYDSQQVVDWYHGTGHLATAAQLLYERDPQEAQRWSEKWKTRLYQGHAEQLAQHLTQAAARGAEAQPQKAEALQTEAGYFLTNQRRMQYMQMREDGWPIGSGMVESGCKQFKHRFAGPGMRWSRAGAERLIPIRTAIMSNRFDAIWNRAFNSPPN